MNSVSGKEKAAWGAPHASAAASRARTTRTRGQYLCIEVSTICNKQVQVIIAPWTRWENNRYKKGFCSKMCPCLIKNVTYNIDIKKSTDTVHQSLYFERAVRILPDFSASFACRFNEKSIYKNLSIGRLVQLRCATLQRICFRQSFSSSRCALNTKFILKH